MGFAAAAFATSAIFVIFCVNNSDSAFASALSTSVVFATALGFGTSAGFFTISDNFGSTVLCSVIEPFDSATFAVSTIGEVPSVVVAVVLLFNKSTGDVVFTAVFVPSVVATTGGAI